MLMQHCNLVITQMRNFLIRSTVDGSAVWFVAEPTNKSDLGNVCSTVEKLSKPEFMPSGSFLVIVSVLGCGLDRTGSIRETGGSDGDVTGRGMFLEGKLGREFPAQVALRLGGVGCRGLDCSWVFCKYVTGNPGEVGYVCCNVLVGGRLVVSKVY